MVTVFPHCSASLFHWEGKVRLLLFFHLSFSVPLLPSPLQLLLRFLPNLLFSQMSQKPSSADPVEIFKEDITELLNSLPEKKVLVSRIPEEFTRHFKKTISVEQV